METKPNTSQTLSDEETTTSRHKPATQACETCRSRKVKCDEERPRCGVCQRLNITCEYREPKPTKRDKTLVHVLDMLKNVERKVDLLVGGVNSRGSLSPTVESSSDSVSRPGPRPFVSFPTPSTSTGSVSQSVSQSVIATYGDMPPSFSIPGQNSIEAREVLMWPTIRSLLQDELIPTPILNSVNGGGEKWLTKITNEFSNDLPVDEPTRFIFVSPTMSSDQGPGALCLTRDIVEDLSQTFFRSFRCMYPILDTHHYYTFTLTQAYQSSFSEYDPSSTLVLLVLALGEVAQLGISGDLIEDGSDRPTGIRGGTPERPPGLAYLNEARKRLGFMMNRTDITVLHCFILFSLYYAQVSRNLDHWRMAEISLIICRNLVKTVDDWQTFEGDIIARAYWMCVLLEGGLTTELGLPRTGIADLESLVPLPLFLSDDPHEPLSSEALIVKYHFLAQITLRAVMNRIDSSLKIFPNPFQSDHTDGSPPEKIIHELLRQLTDWRENLPRPIYWAETTMNFDDLVNHWEASKLWTRITPSFENINVLLDANLRTRYKYAQYLVWRPYVYKVLHFAGAITETDMLGTKEAFQACALWPLTHSTFDDQRRLIPHIYEYSHTIFGVLLLIHALTRVPLLKARFEGTALHEELKTSTVGYLAWMRSMRVVHPVAAWYWDIVRVLYAEHEGVSGVGG